MYSIDNLVINVESCENQKEYLEILKALVDNINKYLNDNNISFSELKEKIIFIIKQRLRYRFTKEI